MLNSLFIKNFRGLTDLNVSKLGKVNLIVGKNDAGKSSVLEALRIYAGNANRPLLNGIASEHDEPYRLIPSVDTAKAEALPYSAFFPGWRYPIERNDSIFIGELEIDSNTLEIGHGFLASIRTLEIDEDGDETIKVSRRLIERNELGEYEDGSVHQVLVVAKGDRKANYRLSSGMPRPISGIKELSDQIGCSFVPTEFLSDEELAEEWDNIVLTSAADFVKEALQIINPLFEELAFVEKREDASGKTSRVARVRLKGLKTPVPLKSMGDGMLRILQLILRIFPAQGGLLLVDEFENGLHYSIQNKVWKLIFRAARDLDIQVFATTHSWDCIKNFSEVACEDGLSDGVLFRIGRSIRKSDAGKIIATVFDEESLYSITQSDIEVR